MSPSIFAYLPGIMEASDYMPSDKVSQVRKCQYNNNIVCYVVEPLLHYIGTIMSKLGQALLTPIFLR